MAFASGLYVLTFRDALDTSDLAINFLLDTHKWALYDSNETPDFDTDTAYTTTNEVSGTGYTAGGKAITGLSPTWGLGNSGQLKYDHDNISWTSATITARGAILYADALTNNDLICAVDFGQNYTATNGTFEIQWHTNGIFTIDLVP